MFNCAFKRNTSKESAKMESRINNNEYHDPDYADASVKVSVSRENVELTEVEKINKIRNIIKKEFAKELLAKEQDIDLIDQRMVEARRVLHRLRYAIVNSYYQNRKMVISEGQVLEEVTAQQDHKSKTEVSLILRNEQKRLHPSLRKLLGKNEVDMEEIFKFRPPRNKAKKDQNLQTSSKNMTIPAEREVQSLRTTPLNVESGITNIKTETPAPVKVPRYIEPKDLDRNVLKIDEVTRNKQKHKYRIIIGNTSKYVPPSSTLDRSTHKWLLYVRGPQNSPDVSRILTGVTVRLHDSYAPHHVVHIGKPPFHLSRRGWGEFPAKLELHFALPRRNRPATVAHTIKLDRQYTGVQTLGAETVVDVWLYSSKEMLKFVYQPSTDKPQIQTPKLEKPNNCMPSNLQSVQGKCWSDFKTDILNDSTDLEPDPNSLLQIKQEPCDEDVNENINLPTEVTKLPEIKREIKSELLDYEEQETQNVNASPKKKIMKCVNPNTGKICYLEMDISLDVKNVQSFVINDANDTKNQYNNATSKMSQPDNVALIKNKSILNPNIKRNNLNVKRNKMSLLKPALKSLLKTDNVSVDNNISKFKTIFKCSHIKNDHCYISTGDWDKVKVYGDNIQNSTVNVMLPDGEKRVLQVKKKIIMTTVQAIDGLDSTNCNRLISYKQDLVVLEKSVDIVNRLKDGVKRIKEYRYAVNFLLQNIPVISELASHPDFVRLFPFAVKSVEKFFSLDLVKRRNLEWSRAKMVNKFLIENFQGRTHHWRTKQILMFARLHGFYPIRTTDSNNPGSRNTMPHVFSNPDQIYTWSLFSGSKNDDTQEKPDKSDSKDDKLKSEISKTIQMIDLTHISDDEIDVVGVDGDSSGVGKAGSRQRMKKELKEQKMVLEIQDQDQKMGCYYLERKCAETGIELRNEDIGEGYLYSLVHMVMMSAMKSFAEDLMRSALCQKRLCSVPDQPQSGIPSAGHVGVWGRTADGLPESVDPRHIYEAIQSNQRFQFLTNEGMATQALDCSEKL